MTMIKDNFDVFPDIRVEFYNFIQKITSKCFKALLSLPAGFFQLVVDAIVWGCKHIEKTVSETSLTTV